MFITVICPAWDSSTWMAIEAELAWQRHQSGRLKYYFSYNPTHLKVAAGMIRYECNALPSTQSEAVAQVLAAATLPAGAAFPGGEPLQSR